MQIDIMRYGYVIRVRNINLDTKIWKKSKAMASMRRSGHTAVLFRNEMIIYGGVIEDDVTKYSLWEALELYNIRKLSVN